MFSTRSALFICIIGLVAVSSCKPVVAHDGEEDHQHPIVAVKPADYYAPTAMPDRIVLTWADDPRTTQSVTWRTSVEVSQGLAQIALATAGPKFVTEAKEFKAVSEALKTDINTAHFHSVTFRDLKPGSVYAYRVGDGVNWSEWFHFRTTSAEVEPFSFVYFGDAQNSIRSLWSRVLREAQRDAPKASFFLHAGDLVNRAESDAEWGEWFGAGGWLNAMLPVVAIPGNHEQARKEDGTRRLSRHWKPTFTFPENGPKGQEESCYTFVYQNVRFVCLNSNQMQAEQTKWMDEVLAKNKQPWVICTFHHPIYSTGKDRDNVELRALWKPILDKYRVDLVLQGHDHTYGRTGFDVPPVSEADRAALKARMAEAIESGSVGVGFKNVPTGVQNIEKAAGTVYVVSVSGPKMYDNNRKWFMRRLAEDTQLYQIIHVDGRRLRFEARTATGELYDSFELVKQPGEVNKIIETGAEVGENLRPLQPAAASEAAK
ncbi:MAG TPA: metallophosphoesterase [Planctomycetaceae bacterium]|nr:metallophosphoesterase [Planctomycetaceae bacterium]